MLLFNLYLFLLDDIIDLEERKNIKSKNIINYNKKF